MIIDARTTTQTKHGRPFTGSAAVANLLDEIPIGESVEVDAFIGPHGQPLNKLRLDTFVAKWRGDRVFSVVKIPNKLARIHRIA